MKDSAKERNALHVVCGPPAGGKTYFGRRLARELKAAFFDSDMVTERVVRAGLAAAGRSPDDRDSPGYKRLFREAVYDTLYALAEENLSQVPVVIAGPFTSECRDTGWLSWLQGRFGTEVTVHVVWCEGEVRKERMQQRGEARDLAKLAHWDAYLATCEWDRPGFTHQWVVSGHKKGASS